MNNRLHWTGLAGCAVLFLAAAWAPALADCDTAPPDLTAFSFTPAAVDVTAASRTVNCTMTFTDNLSGVQEATCTFTDPNFLTSASCTSTTPTSGTRLNGTFQCALTVPRYADNGTWTASVAAVDRVTNTLNAMSFDLLLEGFPTDLAVTSTPDSAFPTLTAFSFSPSSVTVSSAPQNVNCSMTTTDSPAGVASAACFFDAPNTDQAQGCIATSPSSGTRNNGTFTCSVTVPRYSDAGTWKALVFLTDAVGNTVFLDPAALTAQGFPTNLNVTSSPEDVSAPAITSATLNPNSIATAGADTAVTCDVAVTDNLSGVQDVACTVTYTDALDPFLTQEQSCSSATPFSGTRTSGTFRCTLSIPRYSAGGVWDLGVVATDVVGNELSSDRGPLLTVDCGGGGCSPATEATLAWDSKTVLSWNVLCAATRYNVYRGEQTGLKDANLDGYPDGGYGACQNGRDGLLTDGSFTESQTPNSTQKGFHFIVGYRTAGGTEAGLGSTSDGSPRFVTTSCP